MNRIKKCLVVFLVLLLLTGCSKSVGDKLKDMGFSHSKEFEGYVIVKHGTTYIFKGNSTSQFEFYGIGSNYSVIVEMKNDKMTVFESKTNCAITSSGNITGGCTDGSIDFIQDTMKYLSVIIDVLEK